MLKSLIFKFRENIFAFFIALTVLVSGAYSVYRHYDFSYSEDAHSYVSMAQGNYQHLSITHQYRFIAPSIAGIIAQPISLVYSKIWENRGGMEWSVRLSFFIENIFLMSLFGFLLFRLARNENISFWYAILSMIFLLTTRWGIDNAGLPLVEAFYLVCIALMVYGIQTDSLKWQIVALFLGCFAKEAFIFELPALLFFSKQGKIKLIFALIITGIAVWSSRYYINSLTGNIYDQEIANFTRHFKNISVNLLGALKPKGWFETFSAVGFGGFFIFWAIFDKNIRNNTLLKIPFYFYAVFIAAIVQGALGEWGRMLYYGCPLYIIIIGKTMQTLHTSYFTQNNSIHHP